MEKMSNAHCEFMTRNTQKRGTLEMQILGTRIWREK